MDRLGVRQVPEGSAEQGEVEETGCEIIYGAQTTLAVKGKMRDEVRENVDQNLMYYRCSFSCIQVHSL